MIVHVPPRCPRQRPVRCGGNNVGIVINYLISSADYFLRTHCNTIVETYIDLFYDLKNTIDELLKVG